MPAPILPPKFNQPPASGGVSLPQRDPAVVIALLVETTGLVIAVLVAGMSEGAGTIMVIFLVGIWLVWIINHPSVTSKMQAIINNAQQAVNG